MAGFLMRPYYKSLHLAGSEYEPAPHVVGYLQMLSTSGTTPVRGREQAEYLISKKSFPG